jgi:bifunctional non-homologous end joining protein LigD
MPLDRYRQMRDFERTAEPAGEEDTDLAISDHERNGTPRFVVQEHHATALHWDLRLERNGVLVSWAVPKGLPPHPRQNNLAVHTEDHPLSYIDFAGEIPKGEYGGGHMYLWDHGTYEVQKWTDREVMVELRGSRVGGRYVLFQTDGRNWMIHRMDPPADPARELVPHDARPVASVAADALPDVDVDVDGGGWRHLVAWADVRVAIAIDGGRCTAHDEHGKDVTASWQVLRPFGRAVGSLQVVLVAQLVRTGDAKRDPGTLLLDDVAWIDGHATTPLPFDERRDLLDGIELLDGDGWRVNPVYDDGAPLLDAARAQGLTGVLAVRADAPGDEPPTLVRV